MQTQKPRRKRLSLETLERRCMLFAYSVVDLGFLPGDFANEWNDINNAGQVTGNSGANAVVWNPSADRNGSGTLIPLEGLATDDIAVGESISSNGWVAGFSVNFQPGSPSILTPIVWSPDAPNGDLFTMQEIGDSSGTANGRAVGVNSQGKVVGVLNSYDSGQAFVWEQDSGTSHLTDLNTKITGLQYQAAGVEAGVILYEATGINDNNQIVANGVYEEDSDGDGEIDITQLYAFLIEDDDDNGSFHDGGITIRNLGSLGGWTFAEDINVHGQIVGSSLSAKANQGYHAYVWNEGVMTDLGTLRGGSSSFLATTSRGEAISDNGTVVGYGGSLFSPRAFIWQNGRMTDLNKEIPKGSGWELEHGRAVNNSAEVVGRGQAPNDSGDFEGRGYLLSESVTLPKLAIGDASVVEGDLTDGTPVLTEVQVGVTLSEPASEAITVDYYTAGWYESSVEDEDFVSESGQVVFHEGEMNQTITVMVKGDLRAGGNTHDQGDEFFSVNLINPRNATGGQAAVFDDAQGRVTIIEDEPAMSIEDIQLPEGDEGELTPFTFTVNLSVPAKDDVSVNWHTEDNTAKAGIDYVGVESATLVIPQGASSGTITVNVIGDTIDEGTNPFVIRLEKGSVVKAHIPDLDNRTGGFAYGYIENDDGPSGQGKGGKGRNKSTATSIADSENVATLTTSPTAALAESLSDAQSQLDRKPVAKSSDMMPTSVLPRDTILVPDASKQDESDERDSVFSQDDLIDPLDEWLDEVAVALMS